MNREPDPSGQGISEVRRSESEKNFTNREKLNIKEQNGITHVGGAAEASQVVWSSEVRRMGGSSTRTGPLLYMFTVQFIVTSYPVVFKVASICVIGRY
jgi:hypothetical protein